VRRLDAALESGNGGVWITEEDRARRRQAAIVDKANKLRGTFIKAQNILHRMRCDPEFIREGEAEARDLKAEVERHAERA